MSRMIIWVFISWSKLQVRKLRQEAGVSFCKPPSLELGSKNLFKELYIELKPLERDDNQLWPGASVSVTCATTLLWCSRIRSLCGPGSSVLQRWWAVTPIRPGMVGMFSLVARRLPWNPEETIRATPGPPGPDLWPVFGPRNSSFSITRPLL